MNTTEIYSGVPIPETTAGRPPIYPFDKMKVGEHFLWTCDADENIKIRRSSISTSAKSRGFTVKTRTDGKMIRCWMVGKSNGKTS